MSRPSVSSVVSILMSSPSDHHCRNDVVIEIAENVMTTTRAQL